MKSKSKDPFIRLLLYVIFKLTFTDTTTSASSSQDITFITLFPLTYGAIPILGEARNIIYSILEVIGSDKIAEGFINSVNSLSAAKFG